jgi:Kef-type K+ transport system membrane component KefB
MIRRVITLAVVGTLVSFLRPLTEGGARAASAEGTYLLGFTLLAAYLCGQIMEQLKLPRITGYIMAGILFGPFLAGLLDASVMETLDIFNELAYAFIGLAAGAELRLAVLRGRARSIALLIVVTSIVVMVGVGAAFYLVAPRFGVLGGLAGFQLLAVSGVVGVIAAARSPSSAIAVISETRARGPFAETILGVSVAMDAVVIFLFAVAMALAGLAFAPSEGLDLPFIASLLAALVVSLLLGVALGRLLSSYMKRQGPQIPLVVLAFCFLIYRGSILVPSIHLEPLLICAAAGFTIQNFSRQGPRLLEAMDWVALPVYVLFFSLAGARLDLHALVSWWGLALMVAGCRVAMIIMGTKIATGLAGDPQSFRRYAWLGFITQAGLSLALVSQLEDSHPGWGAGLATLLVAVITINQIAGPAAFLFALERVGEARGRRRGWRRQS